MAKRPTRQSRAGVTGTSKLRKSASPAGKSKSPRAAGSKADDSAKLRRDLTAAKSRVMELEKDRRELSRRIEAAIATLNKLLKN